MIIHSEQEMLDFGKNFADRILSKETQSLAKPAKAKVIELIGDVGVGKTTFVRGLAKGLNLKEPVTSPSYTISKSYALPHSNGRLIHYDFYRLSDPGIMTDDLRENLETPTNIIIIEWGESITNLLPQDHTIITIEYTETGDRNLFFKTGFGQDLFHDIISL